MTMRRTMMTMRRGRRATTVLDTMLHKGGELATDMKRGAHMAVDKIGKTTGTTINKIGDVVDGVTGGVLKEGVRGARALKEGLKKGVQHQIKMGMGIFLMKIAMMMTLLFFQKPLKFAMDLSTTVMGKLMKEHWKRFMQIQMEMGLVRKV